MKTLILYATKYGTTAEIAKRIADNIEDSVLHDLKHGDMPTLTDFDCIIIGSSIYAGMIRKEAKVFLSQNADALMAKKYGLFLSGMSQGDEKVLFNTAFRPEVLQCATAVSLLGGVFDPKKVNFIERAIMKAVSKSSEYSSTIDNAKIKDFAGRMKV